MCGTNVSALEHRVWGCNNEKRSCYVRTAVELKHMAFVHQVYQQTKVVMVSLRPSIAQNVVTFVSGPLLLVHCCVVFLYGRRTGFISFRADVCCFIARKVFFFSLALHPLSPRGKALYASITAEKGIAHPKGSLLCCPRSFCALVRFARDKLSMFEGGAGSAMRKETAGDRSSIGALHGKGLVSAWSKVRTRTASES